MNLRLRSSGGVQAHGNDSCLGTRTPGSNRSGSRVVYLIRIRSSFGLAPGTMTRGWGGGRRRTRLGSMEEIRIFMAIRGTIRSTGSIRTVWSPASCLERMSRIVSIGISSRIRICTCFGRMAQKRSSVTRAAGFRSTEGKSKRNHLCGIGTSFAVWSRNL